jgi:hypothetical protein
VQATDKIQSIAAFINERKREAENVSKTLEISNKITGNDKVRALVIIGVKRGQSKRCPATN